MNKLHPLYQVWKSMRQRCFNPNCGNYVNYGARGITVCSRWNDFNLFALDMGPRPEGYSIERIDNDGNYEPSNCCWATKSQQMQNRRPYSIEHRSLQLPNNNEPMRCITRKGLKRFQVRMRVNKREVSKTFKTLEEAINFRADLEDERAMMATLS